jgi:hypothetical protein
MGSGPLAKSLGSVMRQRVGWENNMRQDRRRKQFYEIVVVVFD